jgi:DNA replication licensing factor MCM6
MSSLLDGIIHSDAVSHHPSSSAPRRQRSSSRPQGPPSESAGANSDAEAFADDEVVGVRGNQRRPRVPGDVPRVLDQLGEYLVNEFEEFIET